MLSQELYVSITISPTSLWFPVMVAQEAFKMLLSLFSLLHIKTSWHPVAHLSPTFLPHPTPAKMMPLMVVNLNSPGSQMKFTVCQAFPPLSELWSKCKELISLFSDN